MQGHTYAGFCYDGPLEGQWRSEMSPMFMTVAEEPMWRQPIQFYNPDPVSVKMHQIYYRWSNPLRAWVALNMR